MRLRPANSPLVGRVAELEVLRENQTATTSGVPRTVLVCGEAGIGKTRLVDEFCHGLPDDVTVIVGECVATGAVGTPLAPIRRMLRVLLEEIGEHAFQTAAGFGYPILSAFVPQLAREGRAPPTRPGQLGEAVEELLHSLSRDRPLVLILTDVHWADDDTLSMIQSLVGLLHGCQLLTILTVRTDELPAREQLRGLIGELERTRRATRLQLSPLSEDEVSELLETLTGDSVSESAARAIAQRSEGVPFFVEELAGLEPDALPETLRDVLLAPYRRLGPEARDFVNCLAVGWPRLDLDLVHAVFDRSSLAVASAGAIASGIVTSRGQEYAFRHSLVREAVYAEMLPGTRVGWHAAYGRALADNHGDPAGVAEHWWAAGNREQALTSAIWAAASARRAAAYANAARFDEQAIDLWEQVAQPEALVQMAKWQLLEQAADDWATAGELTRAVQLVDDALGLLPCDHTRDHARLILVNRLRRGHRPGPGSPDPLDHAFALVATSDDPGDRAIAASIRTLQASEHLRAGAIDEAEALVASARTLASGLSQDLRVALVAVETPLLMVRGDVEGAAAAVVGIGDVSNAPLDTRLQYGLIRTRLHGWLEGPASAAEVGDTYYQLARRSGRERALGLPLLLVTAAQLYDLGEWSQARELTLRGLTLKPDAERTCGLLRLLHLHDLWRGDVDSATARYAEHRALITRVCRDNWDLRTDWAIAVAESALSTGNPASAAEALRPVWPPTARGPLFQSAQVAVLVARLDAGWPQDSTRAGWHNDLPSQLAALPEAGFAGLLRRVAEAELITEPIHASEAWRGCLETMG
ncbi:MAG TPA: AAA family ATPase, partial [Propionibacteriaceae bacterium]|nr:AAA family ATPase [Propionibacteriaceae bacterium]